MRQYFLLAVPALVAIAGAAHAQNSAGDLIGSWSHPIAGVWQFGSDGEGSVTQSSNNGNAGQIRTDFRYSVEAGNTLAYTPTQTTLSGSSYDRSEKIDSPKTYRQSFSIDHDRFQFGNFTYTRR